MYSVDELKKTKTRGMPWNALREFLMCKWMPVVEETYGVLSYVFYLINDDLDMVEYCLMCDGCNGIKERCISIYFDNYGKDFEDLAGILGELYYSLYFPDCECEED